jgi:hypothetical protein
MAKSQHYANKINNHLIMVGDQSFRFSWDYEVLTVWTNFVGKCLKNLGFDIVKVLNSIIFKWFVLELCYIQLLVLIMLTKAHTL